MSDTQDDEIREGCQTCAHCLKAIGLGLGYRCKNTANEIDGKMFAIPHRWHKCELWELGSESQRSR